MNHDPRDPEHLAETAAADMTDLSGMPTAAETTGETGETRTGWQGFGGAHEHQFDLETLREFEKQAQAYVRRNPLRSAGLAFAAGLLIAVARRL
jgi:hypothetical protein